MNKRSRKFEIYDEADKLRIYDRVFLGDKNTCKDPSFISSNNITHIVNVSSLKNHFAAPTLLSKPSTNTFEDAVDVDKENVGPTTTTGKTTTKLQTLSDNTHQLDQKSLVVNYLKINIDDSMDTDIKAHFERATRFIQEALSQSDRNAVMVHCKEGKSRSVTMLIAYGMRYMGLTLKQSYDNINTITDGRPRMNDGFKRQLQDYELELQRNAGITNAENSMDFFPSRRKRKVRAIDENGFSVFVDPLQSPTKKMKRSTGAKVSTSLFR